MEEFIQHKDLLLTRNEWFGGDAPSPKVNLARHKLVAKGQAEIVTENIWLGSSGNRKIERKR